MQQAWQWLISKVDFFFASFIQQCSGSAAQFSLENYKIPLLCNACKCYFVLLYLGLRWSVSLNNTETHLSLSLIGQSIYRRHWKAKKVFRKLKWAVFRYLYWIKQLFPTNKLLSINLWDSQSLVLHTRHIRNSCWNSCKNKSTYCYWVL